MTDEEAIYVARAIHEVMRHYDTWKDDYAFDPASGEFHPRSVAFAPPPVTHPLDAFDPLGVSASKPRLA
jgi:hypothetical protein